MSFKRSTLYVGLFCLLFSCGQHKNSKNQKEQLAKLPTAPVENVTPTTDQQARRKQSEAYCKRYDIPIYTNPNALFVDSEAEAIIRTKDEVVDRALALCYIGLKSEGLEQTSLNDINKKYNIYSKFSDSEQVYINSKSPTAQQTADANWRYESLHVMLWALGYIDSLAYPGQPCNVVEDVKIIHDLTEDQFRQKAKLRSKKEILDQADLILRLHWACVDARMNNKTNPANLDTDVVMERHHSLNWLISYMQQDWDNVTTDT